MGSTRSQSGCTKLILLLRASKGTSSSPPSQAAAARSEATAGAGAGVDGQDTRGDTRKEEQEAQALQEVEAEERESALPSLRVAAR